ncbi:uncharacterized protein BDV17DRAFT_286985 [Aspergillus undulatus]|uniref:uncharacterized protein n=1 Tax=Aspergillus undulatus TaxID=1810928 RepID=UPI003CCDF1C9
MAIISKALKSLSKARKASQGSDSEKGAINPINKPASASTPKTAAAEPSSAASDLEAQDAAATDSEEPPRNSKRDRLLKSLKKVFKPISVAAGAVLVCAAGLVCAPILIAVKVTGVVLSIVWRVVGPIILCPVALLCCCFELKD